MPARPAAASRPPSGRTLSRGSRIAIGIATTLLLTANAIGARYYLLPMGERVRSPDHLWLRSSGYVGQSAGILSAIVFALLWLYPARKNLRFLSRVGSLSGWLDVHIALALTLPLLLAVHAAWKFGGIIGLGFDALMIVWASGIVGRYLYVRIPRSASGLELTLDDVANERRSLVTEIAATTGIDPRMLEETLAGASPEGESTNVLRTFAVMLAADRARRRITRELRQRWRSLPGRAPLDDAALDRAVTLAAREISLDQQVRLLRGTQRIFRYWHLLHRPLAIMAVGAVVIHIAVVVAVGATWFW